MYSVSIAQKCGFYSVTFFLNPSESGSGVSPFRRRGTFPGAEAISPVNELQAASYSILCNMITRNLVSISRDLVTIAGLLMDHVTRSDAPKVRGRPPKARHATPQHQ